MNLAPTIMLLTISTVTAIAQNGIHETPGDACLHLNQAVMIHAAKGHLAEAEALLPGTAASRNTRDNDACTGLVLSNMARIMTVLGRMSDAERLAEQSVKILDHFYPPNDWALLRPLQILAAIRLEAGNIARAREALRRIQSIPIERPEDRAIVNGTVGALLQIEGRLSEAEAEYRDALHAWDQAGRGDSADAAAILHCLGALYLREQRIEEARGALDRALVIHDRAQDCLPIDRIKFLNLRSVLHARLGEWAQAEQDLRDALSMADDLPYLDPDLLRPMLTNYSYVLRRNHRRREARSIEARKTALPANSTAALVVDSTELLLKKRR
jgi:tetratricopeptide (TPR) repeat protein